MAGRATRSDLSDGSITVNEDGAVTTSIRANYGRWKQAEERAAEEDTLHAVPALVIAAAVGADALLGIGIATTIYDTATQAVEEVETQSENDGQEPDLEPSNGSGLATVLGAIGAGWDYVFGDDDSSTTTTRNTEETGLPDSPRDTAETPEEKAERERLGDYSNQSGR